MKSAKKYLAAILAVLHILTYSAPVHAQVAEIDASATAKNAGFEAGVSPTEFLGPVEANNLPADGVVRVDLTVQVIPADPAAAPRAAAPVVINFADGSTNYGGNVYIGAGASLLVQIVDALGAVCPSCSAVWDLNSFTNIVILTSLEILQSLLRSL